MRCLRPTPGHRSPFRPPWLLLSAPPQVSRAKFFRGVPAPQGALMAVTPVVLWLRQAAVLASAPAGRVRAAAQAAAALASAASTAGGGSAAGGGACALGGGLAASALERQWAADAWPFPAALPARALAAAWLCGVGGLMVTTWPMLSSKMAMRDPAVESHIRSRSLKTLAAKAAAGGAVLWVLVSVRSWSWLALSLCALVEAALALSVPLGPLVYRLAAK